MTTKGFDVAVVGATGAVGGTLISILAERNFPVQKLYPLASERSVEKTVLFNGKNLPVKELSTFDFSKVQIAFFSAGSSVSQEYVKKAAQAGAWVIDNTSCFRYDNEIPLVVSEVNPDDLAMAKTHHIIANPNCSTMQMMVALKPIYDAVGITRINVATYQAVSGAGRKAVSELASQAASLLNGQSVVSTVFPTQIAFNVFPHIDEFQDNGYTREEMKMVWETQKILHDPSIQVNATAVRVPVFYGHSEAIHLETKQPLRVEEVYKLLAKAPGVKVFKKPEDYPTAFKHATNHDAVWVGRIRRDISHPMGLNLWVVSDNVRKGAALNAVQIAELLLKKHMIDAKI
ncbi:MAG TPA: aspartate-semialdehyde dehydrogenase [Coxiellaceae bacterium]|nr:aspartate-semialdehyde dehydrogenase [Coxiellaceae bacterium]